MCKPKTKCHQLWVLCAIEQNTCKTFFAILWHTPDQTISVYFMYDYLILNHAVPMCPSTITSSFNNSFSFHISHVPINPYIYLGSKDPQNPLQTSLGKHFHWLGPQKNPHPQNAKMLVRFTTQQISCIIQSSFRISDLKTACWFELREAFPFKGPVRIHGKSKLHTLKLTCSPLKMDESGPSQKERIVFQSHPFSGAKAVSFGRGQ